MGIARSIEKNGAYIAGAAAVGIAAVGAVKLYSHLSESSQADEEPSSSSEQVTREQPIETRQIRQPPAGPANACVGGEPAAMCATCIEDPASDQAREHALAYIDSNLMEIMMVHNMKLDGVMKVGEPAYTDPAQAALHERVQSTMKPLFWKMFNEKLKSGNLEPLVAEIEAIKDALKELNPSAEHKAKLEENLSISLIKQMVQHDAMGARQLAAIIEFLCQEIKSFDMPANDDATALFERSLLQKLQCAGNIDMESFLPELLSWLNDKLKEVKHSRANYMLERIQPVVKMQGAEIERDFVTTAISKGDIQLERTKAWLKTNIVASDATADRLKLAVYRGTCGLLGAPVAASRNPEYPESLSLDTTRIENLQNLLQLMALTASCFEELSQIIKDAKQGAGLQLSEEQENEIKVNVMERLASPIQPMAQVQQFAVQFVHKLLTEQRKEMDAKAAEELLKKIAWKAGAVCSPDNRVVPLMLQKLLSGWVAMCMAPEGQDPMDVMKTANAFAFKKFGCFKAQLKEMLTMYRNICDLNLAVYEFIYRTELSKDSPNPLK